MSEETVFHPFEMERLMSKFENTVEYNLSESGAHPLSLRQLLGESSLMDELLDTEFHYPQTNGIPELRENIAAMYPGAAADNVLVTVGAAEEVRSSGDPRIQNLLMRRFEEETLDPDEYLARLTGEGV